VPAEPCSLPYQNEIMIIFSCLPADQVSKKPDPGRSQKSKAHRAGGLLWSLRRRSSPVGQCGELPPRTEHLAQAGRRQPAITTAYALRRCEVTYRADNQRVLVRALKVRLSGMVMLALAKTVAYRHRQMSDARWLRCQYSSMQEDFSSIDAMKLLL
jgi:hypothetical protein